jgi:hypothetical protein
MSSTKIIMYNIIKILLLNFIGQSLSYIHVHLIHRIHHGNGDLTIGTWAGTRADLGRHQSDGP